jgi:hypothetical protein
MAFSIPAMALATFEVIFQRSACELFGGLYQKVEQEVKARAKALAERMDGRGTKHALAEIIAKRFPEELGSRLPPKRKPWMSEDSRMNIFDAVALALLPHLCRRH